MNTDKIAYSVLELVLVPEEDTLHNTFNNSLLLAQKAESFGYKRFWLAEHHNSISIASSATATLMAYIAAGTKSIRVGSGGIMLPNHSPLIVAEQLGTLGNIYPDRIDLGLGRAPGTDMQTVQAIRSDFMQAAHSFPQEVSKIQQYFSVANRTAAVRATVAEGVEVPIYILGSSTDSAHLAAQKGLPYAFAGHFATEKLHQAFAVYRSEFAASDVLQKPYTISGVNIIVADTDEEAERLSTSFIRLFVGILTGHKDYFKKPTAMTDELKAIAQQPAIASMLKYSFVGSKATVKKQISGFIEQTGINELMVVSNVYDSEARIQSYQMFAEIMDELNEEQ